MAVNTGIDASARNQQVQVGLLDVDSGTGTCSTNAVTINKAVGVITTETLTTAAGVTQAITLTNSEIAAGDIVFAICDPATSAGTPEVASVAITAATAVILLKNTHASAALDAAVKIYFMLIKSRSAGNFSLPV